MTPEQHFVNWQQDPYGNWVARFVFPEPTRELSFTVDLVASMTVINPFDFFVEQYAEHYPFAYTEQLAYELAPYLTPEPAGAALRRVARGACGASLPRPGIGTADFLVELNRRAQRRHPLSGAHGARRADARGDARAGAAARAATRAGCWCRRSATSGSRRASSRAT